MGNINREQEKNRSDWTHTFHSHFFKYNKALQENNLEERREQALDILDMFDETTFEEPCYDILENEEIEFIESLNEVLSGKWKDSMIQTGKLNRKKLSEYEIDKKIGNEKTINQYLDVAMEVGNIIDIAKLTDIMSFRGYGRSLDYISKDANYNGRFMSSYTKACRACKDRYQKDIEAYER